MNLLKSVYLTSILAVATASPFWVAAVNASERQDQAKPATAGAKVDGEVKKIDKSAGKVTIKHGPLTNLNMPAMTMVFRVKDPAMFDQLKQGDKIRFTAENVNGAITVVVLEPAK